MEATNGRVLYRVVKHALRSSNIQWKPNNKNAVLVWADTIRAEFFDQLRPYQVINRIPWTQTMCRKVPFALLLLRAARYFPDEYNFLPKTYILPNEIKELDIAVKKGEKTHIYKPDKGSLGQGIRIIQPKEPLVQFPHGLAIAQEYVDSYVIDDRKFDLRIYALIASLDPLTIYVFRNGVARFCTESVSERSKFSLLTNTAVNSKNPHAIPDKMTRMIVDVFGYIEKMGGDVEKLWNEIDKVIVLSVISGMNYLRKSTNEQCPGYGINRCFQIIGFDILLDKNLKPYILEINYRPSMKCNTDKAFELKEKMIMDAIKIAAPLEPLQELLGNTKYFTDPEEYRDFLSKNEDVICKVKELQKENEEKNGFEKIYPNPSYPKYDEILEKISMLPTNNTINNNSKEEGDLPLHLLNSPTKCINMHRLRAMFPERYKGEDL